MKALAQDGSDVPKKIIMKKTLGYGSPRSQEQTPEMKDADEEAEREKTEKNKIGQIPMTRVRLTRRGGETQLKACGLIGKQSEFRRARRHRERSLSGGETCFSVRRSAALRPAFSSSSSSTSPPRGLITISAQRLIHADTHMRPV